MTQSGAEVVKATTIPTITETTMQARMTRSRPSRIEASPHSILAGTPISATSVASKVIEIMKLPG